MSRNRQADPWVPVILPVVLNGMKYDRAEDFEEAFSRGRTDAVVFRRWLIRLTEEAGKASKPAEPDSDWNQVARALMGVIAAFKRRDIDRAQARTAENDARKVAEMVQSNTVRRGREANRGMNAMALGLAIASTPQWAASAVCLAAADLVQAVRTAQSSTLIAKLAIKVVIAAAWSERVNKTELVLYDNLFAALLEEMQRP